MAELTSYSGRLVAVLGLAKSGLAAARALNRSGATIWAWDDDPAKRRDAELSGIAVTDLTRIDWSKLAALVLSPGIPHTFPKPHPVAVLAKEHRCPIIGDIDRARRRELTGPVVAITGTNGKTSTKEMLAAVLATRYRVYGTRANLNNLVGVPTTILEAPADIEALVVEAGANLPGEIAQYRAIIEPSLTVVTNAVEGHLEGFGSLAGVIAEKLSLTDGVPLAIVGTQPPELATGARQRARAVRTAALERADLTPDAVELGPDARPILTFGDVRFTLAARGLHQADNATRVWAVVEALGLDRQASARALEGFSMPGGRGELLEAGGLTILNDCYNANPQSFRAAIATARALRNGRRLVFIAGTMRELGPESAALHAGVARALVELAPDLLGAVGDFVPALAPYAAQLGDRLVTAPDPLALGPLIATRLEGGEVVVLKASRGVALERILPALTNRATPRR